MKSMINIIRYLLILYGITEDNSRQKRFREDCNETEKWIRKKMGFPSKSTIYIICAFDNY